MHGIRHFRAPVADIHRDGTARGIENPAPVNVVEIRALGPCDSHRRHANESGERPGGSHGPRASMNSPRRGRGSGSSFDRS